MTTPEQRLPDPEVIKNAAISLTQAAPAGWTRIAYILWYPDAVEDVIWARMWVDTPGEENARIMPPRTTPALLRKLHDQQVEAGNEAWRRCDLVISRETASADPTFKVDFAYEVGDIPE